ncbi:amidohydrolase [bacterium]|nr:amidohydrolase [bacterium]
MIITVSAVTLISCGRTADTTVDLVIHNARIWTGEQNSPFASVLVISGDRILAVGGDDLKVRYMEKAKEVIDGQEKFITPGFIDSHVHFLSSSYGLSSVKLRDAATPAEFAGRIKEKATALPKGSWILDGDWDHTLWGGELPEASWIDEFTPDHPVCVVRLDGHMILANSLAMRLAGISKNTPDVDGGTIVRDGNGNPTGIFKDNAASLVYAVIPEHTPEQDDAAFLEGMRFVASKGVTTVHNMDLEDAAVIEKYRRVKDRHITRFYVGVILSEWEALRDIIEKDGYGDEWLKIGFSKCMLDGSLGSHTAGFFEPYTDQPEDTGLYLLSKEKLQARAAGADAAGLQLAIHAIGDRAVSDVLDVYEQVIARNGERDRRLRIEHSQHLRRRDFERFRKLGVIASVQPYHAIDDGRWLEEIIGKERAETSYAFRSFLDAGVTLAFGSDWSVAPPTPLEGIYAAVTRRTLDGRNPDGWIPAEKITVEEALRAYTVNAAYASFDEDIKGSLKAGKLADFVILDQNLLEIDPVLIKDVKILCTYTGGKQVYPYH